MENDKTIGEALIDVLNKKSEEYNKIIKDLFIYGPDILNQKISELKEKENEIDN